MKKAGFASLFVMTLAAATGWAQTNAAPVAQFTLAISAVQSTIRAGEKVSIEIVMTNTSTKPMPQQGSIEDQGYMVDVTVGSIAASDTDRGRLWKKDGGMREVTSGPTWLLKPGETSKGSLAISDLYDLSHPGKYSVQVRRGTVKSNSVTVTVTP